MGEVCVCCGNELDEGKEIFQKGQFFCEDCFDVFTVCDKCHKVVLRDNVSYVGGHGNERYYCHDCITMFTFFCENCGERYDYGEMGCTYEERIGGNICDDCLDNYYYCSECEHYVSDDDWDSDEECCRWCAKPNTDLIGSYHSTDKYFIGKCEKAWHNRWRGLGFELEVDRNEKDKDNERELAEKLYKVTRCECNNRISLERDGSLENGFEIISMPHTEKEFFAYDWGQVLNLCEEYGYRSHDKKTCGLHIHVSRNYFGADYDKQITAISKISYFYEHFWDDLLKASRRTANQAADWAQRYCEKDRKQLHKIHKLKACGRYYAVNTTNEDTIEFRLGRCTLNGKSFYAWIDLTLTLVHNSTKISWADVENLALWFRGIKKETYDYLKTKNAFMEVKNICA